MSHFEAKNRPRIVPFCNVWEGVLRKSMKTKTCVSTGQTRTDCIWALPVERSMRPKIQQKNEYISGTRFFTWEMRKYLKHDLKMPPKTWLYFGDGRLGALLGHLWQPSPFFNTKSVAKVLQKWPQGRQSAPKVLPKYPKRAPKVMTNPTF